MHCSVVVPPDLSLDEGVGSAQDWAMEEGTRCSGRSFCYADAVVDGAAQCSRSGVPVRFDRL